MVLYFNKMVEAEFILIFYFINDYYFLLDLLD
jgi:hypothetical protein